MYSTIPELAPDLQLDSIVTLGSSLAFGYSYHAMNEQKFDANRVPFRIISKFWPSHLQEYNEIFVASPVYDLAKLNHLTAAISSWLNPLPVSAEHTVRSTSTVFEADARCIR